MYTLYCLPIGPHSRLPQLPRISRQQQPRSAAIRQSDSTARSRSSTPYNARRDTPRTLICLFIVMQNSVMKYMTRMGQNTGMLQKSNMVHTMAITVDLHTEYQNLNSGSRRMNGRNSSLDRVGSSGPSSVTTRP